MDDKDCTNKTLEAETAPPKNTKENPDEKLGFYFSSAITIKDIDTDEVLLKIRGD